jgi:ATP-dependent Lhr-like helicase
MESIGPTTTTELAARLRLPAQAISQSFLRLEASGQVLRGQFRPIGRIENSKLKIENSGEAGASPEWCHRRLLARIHRLTIGKLRKEVEPVTAVEFMRFLLQWQHVAPGSRLHGEAGLLEVVRQLAGFEAAASAWEPQLLRLRLAKYEPEILDRLCLSGDVSWGRLTPHPRLSEVSDPERIRRIAPTSVAPISLFPREESEWLMEVFHRGAVSAGLNLCGPLSGVAQDLRRVLSERGASFFADLVRMTNHLPAEVEEGLWELVAAGLVAADGFDNLRALMDPRRRRAEGRERSRRPRHSAGRWSLLRQAESCSLDRTRGPEQVEGQLAAVSLSERTARQLLRRYGVVFRDLLARESLVHSWRDLLLQYRRMEMTGEVRGGRFVSGFTGEQFSSPEAVESLRAMRKSPPSTASQQQVRISASDPLNLVGVILPGARVPAIPTNYIVFHDGLPVQIGMVRDERPVDLHVTGHSYSTPVG